MPARLCRFSASVIRSGARNCSDFAQVKATPCRHGIAQAAGCATDESVFEIDANRVRFGVGALREAGDACRHTLGMNQRVLLFTDPSVRQLEWFDDVFSSLLSAGLDVVVFDEVLIEPTDSSFERAIQFAREAGKIDGFVSIGGGSVMDTAKAANLMYSCPPPSGQLLEYVNAPIGAGVQPRMLGGGVSPLRPHIACPTTCGTGSEVTGIAIFDQLAAKAKTGIANRAIRPTMAIVDPRVTSTLPKMVVACSGFDVLAHAVESYTALPFTHRSRPATPHERPLSQGSNPWADVGCLEALRIAGRYLGRAVNDGSDTEARHQLMFAALLAGVAFGNSGVHLPHGLSYSIAGLVPDAYAPQGYPNPRGKADAGHLCGIVPHGMAVVLGAPACMRFTAPADPARHISAAEALGADVRGAVGPEDAGEVLADKMVELMRECAMPNGLGGVGFGTGDVHALAAGAAPQKRLLNNSPRPVTEADLRDVIGDAVTYW